MRWLRRKRGHSVATLGAGAGAEGVVGVAASDGADDDVSLESSLVRILAMVGDAAMGGSDKDEASVRVVTAGVGATTVRVVLNVVY